MYYEKNCIEQMQLRVFHDCIHQISKKTNSFQYMWEMGQLVFLTDAVAFGELESIAIIVFF